MRLFYIKDKNTNVAVRGFKATTEINCFPFDYFRFGHAHFYATWLRDIFLHSPLSIHDDLVRKFALQETDEMISQILSKSEPLPAIQRLLTDESISYKKQQKLLKGLTLTSKDILWLNKEAQDNGYLLNIYHEEKYPEKFIKKTKPVFIHQNNDNTIDKIGSTDMTEGELRALLKQRKAIQARVYHKNKIWHCFYFTYKGLAGEECGLMGSKSHYHYISYKSGITWNDLMKRIKDCNMPSSKVHILIDRQ